jgi:hypothetical protein
MVRFFQFSKFFTYSAVLIFNNNITLFNVEKHFNVENIYTEPSFNVENIYTEPSSRFAVTKFRQV